MSIVAAINPQLIGIVAASAIVVILLVVLFLRRRSGSSAPEQAAAPPAASFSQPPQGAGQGSFLDEPLDKGFDRLGKQAGDRPGLGTVVLPKEMRPGMPATPTPMSTPPAVTASPPVEPVATAPAPQMAPAPQATPETMSVPEATSEPSPAPPQPEPAPAAPTPAPLAPEAADDTAHLSDIIVTTNQQEIDLTDPDVRQMLVELVNDEMALAEVYKSQGQVLDAILQLTEAEKASQALGDAELTSRIKAMLDQLQP